MFKDWLDIYKQINARGGESDLFICPECGHATVDFQYVGKESDRIGYIDMWCSTCGKGAHLSRVAIPPSALMLSFDVPDDVLAARIPDFEQVTPSE
jgi:transcription elongation factor Elf1